jgi:hypothetical protein
LEIVRLLAGLFSAELTPAAAVRFRLKSEHMFVVQEHHSTLKKYVNR